VPTARPRSLCRKTFPRKSIHTEVSPLRTPGFPVESRGVGQHHAVSFTGNRTRCPGKCCEVGNRGTLRSRWQRGGRCFQGEWLLGQEPFFVSLSGTQAHDSSRENHLRAYASHIQVQLRRMIEWPKSVTRTMSSPPSIRFHRSAVGPMIGGSCARENARDPE
jgi:hypothetical protein